MVECENLSLFGSAHVFQLPEVLENLFHFLLAHSELLHVLVLGGIFRIELLILLNLLNGLQIVLSFIEFLFLVAQEVVVILLVRNLDLLLIMGLLLSSLVLLAVWVVRVLVREVQFLVD